MDKESERDKNKFISELSDLSSLSSDKIKDELGFDNKISCESCGSSIIDFIETPVSIHYGKYVCGECRTFIKWVSYPEKDKKRKPNKLLRIGKEKIDYCELCLRNKKDLLDRTVLEEHHILEFETNPELDNEKRNRWVICTDCHRFIHFIRRYSNRSE